MFLQRLASSLRKRNWESLILEILVLVAGVFLGLQVDSWYESQQDRQDEQRVIAQLHGDVLLAEQLSERVRGRRVGTLQDLISAIDVLFERVDRAALTQDECDAVGSINVFTITAADLPSFHELLSTGRLHILRNDELRSALLNLEQLKNGLNEIISQLTTLVPDLVRSYPNLIREDAYFVPGDEVRTTDSCDTEGMRANRAFLNDFSLGIDAYDAYLRDGLAPWLEQLDRVHSLVDFEMKLNHPAAEPE